MNKAIIFFAFLVVALAFAEANKRQCRRVCIEGRPSMTRCVMDTKGCRKMDMCAVQEENCIRRMNNKTLLKITHSYHCRYIKGPYGSGHCAEKPVRFGRNVRPNCHHKQCYNPSQKLKCYRSHNKQCQLLTACQVRLVNCHRGQNNALSLVDSHQCMGMRAGQRLKPCRRFPHKV